MKERSVVTCFLVRTGESGDEVLLLRRSDRVSTYRGLWAGVSGYLETDSPLEQAYRELSEEVGLERDDVTLVAQAEPVTVSDESIDTRWTVHLFLFRTERPDRVRLDWEHTASSWVKPAEIGEAATVPGLAEGLRRLYERRGARGPSASGH
jgi:8-oxo-dGTP pyrophosphatase MutT (NUDIX family)